MNLASSTITSTVPVMVRPTPLITRERCIRLRTAGRCSVFRCRVQCRSMPSWLTVNETKTPTTYSWISAVTSALNATMSTIAKKASTRMPLL